jgi:hypothetical protein
VNRQTEESANLTKVSRDCPILEAERKKNEKKIDSQRHGTQSSVPSLHNGHARREGREEGKEKIFKAVVAKNSPNLMEITNVYNPEAQ